MLEDARRQQQLSELSTQARGLHAQGDWPAVVGLFERIRAVDPSYPDPEGLEASARRELTRQTQEAAGRERLAQLEREHQAAEREQLESFELLRTLPGPFPSDKVASVAFSPDGQLLASGLEDGSVRLWQRARRIH